MPRAQFTPFVSQVSPTFWNTLSTLKLNEYRLDDALMRAHAEYAPAISGADRRDDAGGRGGPLRLGGDGIVPAAQALDAHESTAPRMYGYVKNFNTLHEFKAADKQAYFYQVVDEVGVITHRDLGRHYRRRKRGAGDRR